MGQQEAAPGLVSHRGATPALGWGPSFGVLRTRWGGVGFGRRSACRPPRPDKRRGGGGDEQYEGGVPRALLHAVDCGGSSSIAVHARHACNVAAWPWRWGWAGGMMAMMPGAAPLHPLPRPSSPTSQRNLAAAVRAQRAHGALKGGGQPFKAAAGNKQHPSPRYHPALSPVPPPPRLPSHQFTQGPRTPPHDARPHLTAAAVATGFG